MKLCAYSYAFKWHHKPHYNEQNPCDHQECTCKLMCLTFIWVEIVTTINHALSQHLIGYLLTKTGPVGFYHCHINNTFVSNTKEPSKKSFLWFPTIQKKIFENWSYQHLITLIMNFISKFKLNFHKLCSKLKRLKIFAMRRRNTF